MVSCEMYYQLIQLPPTEKVLRFDFSSQLDLFTHVYRLRLYIYCGTTWYRRRPPFSTSQIRSCW